MRTDLSLETVYGVARPIPALGAMPGDEIIVRPTDPDFPLEVRRTFDLEMLAAIPEYAVQLLVAEPTSDASTSPATAPTRSALRLVR